MCCFGSFEAQTLLPRLKSDLGDVLLSLIGEKLSDTVLEWEHKMSVCIGVFSKRPLTKSGTGLPVTGLEEIKEMKDIVLFYENAFFHEAGNIKSGDRLIDVTAVGDDIRETANKAYEAVRRISFEGMYYQKDIGKC
jgi:phosphoribosylamine--glycine ligase